MRGSNAIFWSYDSQMARFSKDSPSKSDASSDARMVRALAKTLDELMGTGARTSVLNFMDDQNSIHQIPNESAAAEVEEGSLHGSLTAKEYSRFQIEKILRQVFGPTAAGPILARFDFELGMEERAASS
ncbi:MAG TPA: hypothetical protein VFA15_04775 [Nitrososphaera sp.]|nr:hypothetical protein [Nitrososphaera sp.]